MVMFISIKLFVADGFGLTIEIGGKPTPVFDCVPNGKLSS
jgi:hypothetical protein